MMIEMILTCSGLGTVAGLVGIGGSTLLNGARTDI